jgi:hypothetical protein
MILFCTVTLLYCLVVRTRHIWFSSAIVRGLLRGARSREPDLPQVRCTFAGTDLIDLIMSYTVLAALTSSYARK